MSYKDPNREYFYRNVKRITPTERNSPFFEADELEDDYESWLIDQKLKRERGY